MTQRLRTPDPRLTRPNLRRVLATVIAVLLAVLAYQTLGPSADNGGVELSTSSVLTGPGVPRSATALAPTPTPVPTTAPVLLPSPTPTPPPTVVEERATRSDDPSRVAVAQSGAVATEPGDVAATPPAPTTAPAAAAAPAQQQPAPTSPPVVAIAPTVPPDPTPAPPTPVPVEPTATIVATPAPTSTPIPTPTSPPISGSGYVSYVLGEINSVRANAGLGPLILMPELSAIAADWSAQMAVVGNISHRPGSQLGAMMPAGWQRWAENVATAPDIAWAQSALEQSPGHYANMVGPSFTHVGIGIAIGDYGSVWVTQNFATY